MMAPEWSCPSDYQGAVGIASGLSPAPPPASWPEGPWANSRRHCADQKPSHLSGELFKMMAGVELLHVPYRGEPQGAH
jgi:Tripartite tricarboxylate transporter family receptor